MVKPTSRPLISGLFTLDIKQYLIENNKRDDMSDHRILIIEDDPDIREVLQLQLELKNYQVTTSGSFSEAKPHIDSDHYDLFLIDRMLPDVPGTQICQYLRTESSHKTAPIILVTAMGESENIIEGLDAGANDYIVKPFDINILHARVRAQLRSRANTPPKNKYKIGKLSLDIEQHEVLYEQEPVSLTHTEFQILKALAEKPGIVFSRRKLISIVLGDEVHVTNRTIDTHIAGLRKKIKTSADYIETIRGVGYRLKLDE